MHGHHSLRDLDETGDRGLPEGGHPHGHRSHGHRSDGDAADGGDGRQGGRHHRHGRGGHRGRVFDYGELRLLILAMLAEQPRHGYEIIKAIEERFGGSYTPSPGVVYPTLAWLDDMGYADIEAEAGGRKLYRVTAEGETFLSANRAAADALLARSGAGAEGGPGAIPAPVLRGMENLKLALRLRLRQGPIERDAAQNIAAALDAAAQAVERS